MASDLDGLLTLEKPVLLPESGLESLLTTQLARMTAASVSGDTSTADRIAASSPDSGDLLDILWFPTFSDLNHHFLEDRVFLQQASTILQLACIGQGALFPAIVHYLARPREKPMLRRSVHVHCPLHTLMHRDRCHLCHRETLTRSRSLLTLQKRL